MKLVLFGGQGKPDLKLNVRSSNRDFVSSLGDKLNLNYKNVSRLGNRETVLCLFADYFNWLEDYGDKHKSSTRVACGHSVGQLFAWHFAGFLSDQSLIDVLSKRTNYLSDNGVSGSCMCSNIGMSMSGRRVFERYIEGKNIFISVDNSDGNISVSLMRHHLAEFKAAVENNFSALVMELPSEFGWHSPFVNEDIGLTFRSEIQFGLPSSIVSIDNSSLDVVSRENISVNYLNNLIITSIYSRVRWRESLLLALNEFEIDELVYSSDLIKKVTRFNGSLDIKQCVDF